MLFRSGNGSLGSSVAGGCCSDDAEKEELLNHMLLEQLLDSLEPGDRDLICMRYFQNKTQTEIAARLGVSQVQVSRLEKRILLKLREKVQ